MPQGLLKWDARHLVQPCGLRFVLPLGEQRGRLNVTDAPLFRIPSPGSFFQSAVVDVADAPEGPRQQLSLLPGRVETVLVRPLRHVSYSTSLACERRFFESAISAPLRGKPNSSPG